MTKIIATIGPATKSKTVLRQLITAGMDVARLNFSHGSHEEHKKVIKRIRSLSSQMNIPIAILGDLQGPKIRTGAFKGGKPLLLKKGNLVTITTKKVSAAEEMITTVYKNLARDVATGNTILIDDGLIELKVVAKTNHTVTARIVHGGVLKEHKGINLPEVTVSAPSLTPKDKKDLLFGIAMGIDYFALSFIRRAGDLRNIKSIMRAHNAKIPVIAKIEKPEAVKNLDDIIKTADGIMVARGDLGVELRPEQVPTIQKRIIRRAIQANKVVITATQMLETMTANPIPTRAEASDVANAIFDGTDAIMLSGETATGKYPVKTVQTMARIAEDAEHSPFMTYNLPHEKDPKDLIPHSVAQSAVNILHEVNARAIVAFSWSGKTSKLISKQRPSRPVYALTPLKETYNRLALIWGIIPILIKPINDTRNLIAAGENILLNKKFVKKNSLVIIVTGLALKTGSTNLIKIHRIGQKD